MADSTQAGARQQSLLIVHNIPPNWRWKDLKDYARNATDRVRAELYPESHTSERVGLLTVNGQEDARRLYCFLRDRFCQQEKPMAVHWFNVTNANQNPWFVACTCLPDQDDAERFFKGPRALASTRRFRDCPENLACNYVMNANANTFFPGTPPYQVNFQGPNGSPTALGRSHEPTIPQTGSPGGTVPPSGSNEAPTYTTREYIRTETRIVHYSRDTESSERNTETPPTSETMRQPAIADGSGPRPPRSAARKGSK